MTRVIHAMEIIKTQLQLFESVSLPELEKVSLLDRMDTKYVFAREQLPEFLEILSDKYFILEISEKRIFKYESLYFDTDDFLLYNHHYCGRLNRYKVRFRKYVESNLSFFEIKFKNNKGRTIKSRIQHIPEDAIQGKALDLLQDKTPLEGTGLKAKFWVNYSRITLVSKDFKERLTLDCDLEFRNDQAVKTLNHLVIAEVKQSKVGRSVFSRLMKDYHIRIGSISKYCFGVVSLFENVRNNNFKPQLIYLNRLLYAAPTGS